MTDTINDVPRELLERVLYLMDNYIGTTHTEEDELRALLSAPSPAGVDADHIEDVRAMVKAQGVVMPERWNVPRPMWKDARQPYGNPLNHADIEAAEKFNLALDEVSRLNAAPAQQVSVPDDFVCDSKPLQELLNATAMLLETPCQDSATYWAAQLANVEQLLAAPAAPAAEAWIPVSERLPAVESRLDQECRVGTLSIAPLNISAAVLVFDGEKVKSTRLEWFDGCLPLPYCITHWMPLPAAPAAHRAKGVV